MSGLANFSTNKHTLKKLVGLNFTYKPLSQFAYSIHQFFFCCSTAGYFLNWGINLYQEKNNEWSTEQCLIANSISLLKELLSSERHLASPISPNPTHSYTVDKRHLISTLITLLFSHSATAGLSLLVVHRIKPFLSQSFWSLCSLCWQCFSTHH